MEEIQGKYHRWSQTGKDCVRINADCSRCTLSQATGFHKGNTGSKKCNQPEANAQLIFRNVPMSEADEKEILAEKGIRITYGLAAFKGHSQSELDELGYRLKTELVNQIIRTPGIACSSMVKQLNQSNFLEQEWDDISIRNHLNSLKNKGFILIDCGRWTSVKPLDKTAFIRPKGIRLKLLKNT